jgi:21S rRNA (GM2251-2'-O)-methyltransferase
MAVIHGINPVRAALQAARRTPQALFVTLSFGSTSDKRAAARQAELLALAAQNNVVVHRVSKGHINDLTDSTSHQGVALECSKLSVPHWSPKHAQTLLSSPSARRLWLALDGIQDPMQLGSIIRTSYFFGVEALLISSSCAPISASVCKASAGAVEYAPLVSTPQLSPALLHLADEHAFTTIAAEITASRHSLTVREYQNFSAVVLSIGSEGFGLSPATKRACKYHLTLSPSPGVALDLDSMGANAAVAACVALFHMN